MSIRSPITRATALTGRRAECELLDEVLASIEAGESRTLVIRGEPGVGKTALLEYVADSARACRVERAAGVQAEMELAFAGLHQLLAPMLDHVESVPAVQRDALHTALGLSSGPPPNLFLVGLAALSLVSEVAQEKPVLCLVDDLQWLDHESGQVLAFVARRLRADAVGIVLGARTVSEGLAGLPELALEGLDEADAARLLDCSVSGPLDPVVRDRIVREVAGNPLALLELTRGLTPAELAGGFGLPTLASLGTSIEESFRRQLDALPAETVSFLQLAAADPLGDPALLWRAAQELPVSADAAGAAIDAGLVELGAQVRFRHPLARSAAYRSMSSDQRRNAHRALAAATDPKTDPDRRAWHLADAASSPDERVARELERSASRAQARGGLAAAAAFLERAGKLTPEPGLRAGRLVAAAKAKREAGALDAALGLLVVAEGGPLDALRAAEATHLRGQIAFDQRRIGDASLLLLEAARRLEPLDVAAARDAHLEALGAAFYAYEPERLHESARAARAAPKLERPRAVDLVLDALALRFTDGHAAAAPVLTRALESFLAIGTGPNEADRWLWLAGSRANDTIALDLWDADSWHEVTVRQVQFARETGALVHLQFTNALLATCHILRGDLSQAALVIEEDRVIAEATRNPRMEYTDIALAAFRGRESEASALIVAALQEARSAGLGRVINFATCLSAVLYNGLGRHDAALEAARECFEGDEPGHGGLVIAEAAEAASRSGDEALARAALERMSARARVTPTDWALGIEARIRGLLGSGDEAERQYRESIARLERTPLRVEQARAHLLYGEWLRRQRRRVDAREQLRTAHQMYLAMGLEGFATRARRELLATGETVRKRTVETRDELTPQERQIARLARVGFSNPEIGTRLFISPRTVQYHLRKIFIKLGISSRLELEQALPDEPDASGLS